MTDFSHSTLSTVSTNLAVMVYLFGGAFLLGASNDVAILGDSLYDGKEMADRGGVIVVTVNYRVGTLGFLSSGDQRMPGVTTHDVWFQDNSRLDVKSRCPGWSGASLPAANFPACDQESGNDCSYQCRSQRRQGNQGNHHTVPKQLH